MLVNKKYHTSEYQIFYKTENGKRRKIYKLPYYPDRIAQWAILQVIEPCLMKHLISDTYSAIPGRGIHRGLSRITQALQNDSEHCQYCLKIDARHYYQSINHDILKQKYRKMFKDKDLLWLLDEIIDSINTADDEDLVLIYMLEEEIDPNTGMLMHIMKVRLKGVRRMKDYGKQRSTIKPDKLELTETKVFVSTDITEVNELGTDERPGFVGYEFNLVEYDKDEFIKNQSEKNADLEEQVTQTQIALCSMFESMN